MKTHTLSSILIILVCIVSTTTLSAQNSGFANQPTLMVTHCGDSGEGSLREAINQANLIAGPSWISFNIPKDVPGYDAARGVWVIEPQSSLPEIIDGGTTIDGFSQKEFMQEDTNPFGPEICINGTNAGGSLGLLEVKAGGILIRGLTINHSGNMGIYVNQSEGVRISGCYVGTDYSGSESDENSYGIWIDDSHHIEIVPEDTFRNVISGNKNVGISVSDTSHHIIIAGNIIGLDWTGKKPIGNKNYGGIRIDGNCDSVFVFDNWIGENTYGVFMMETHHTLVQNNWIGCRMKEDEVLDLGNENDGVYLIQNATDNLIVENNIRFNGYNGVEIYGSDCVRNRVSHNHISGNASAGILNNDGGNNNLAPPVIAQASSTSVTGTAVAGATVEIYTDPGNQGLLFQGETVADASGNFQWEGMIHGPYQNVTAIAIDTEGNTSRFSNTVVLTTGIVQENETDIPGSYSLSGNFPNPFNPETGIQYEIPLTAEGRVPVRICIYNLQGRLIRTLINEEKAPGKYEIMWDGTGDDKQRTASGFYFCTMTARDFKATRRMLFIK